MAERQDPRRRRRIGVALIVLVILLFAVQLTALATGRIVLSGVCFAVLVAGWFVLRSFVRRREREA